MGLICPEDALLVYTDAVHVCARVLSEPLRGLRSQWQWVWNPKLRWQTRTCLRLVGMRFMHALTKTVSAVSVVRHIPRASANALWLFESGSWHDFITPGEWGAIFLMCNILSGVCMWVELWPPLILSHWAGEGQRLGGECKGVVNQALQQAVPGTRLCTSVLLSSEEGCLALVAQRLACILLVSGCLHFNRLATKNFFPLSLGQLVARHCCQLRCTLSLVFLGLRPRGCERSSLGRMRDQIRSYWDTRSVRDCSEVRSCRTSRCHKVLSMDPRGMCLSNSGPVSA